MKTKRITQCQRVLKALKRHRYISAWNLTLDTQCLNLTGRISDLRAMGHRIDNQKFQRDGQTYSVYRLA